MWVGLAVTQLPSAFRANLSLTLSARRSTSHPTLLATAKQLALQGGKSLEGISADIRMRLHTIENKPS
jgi:hypothetical protein